MTDEEKEALNWRIDKLLDEMFIGIGPKDFRLHPMYARSMREVRIRLVQAVQEMQEGK
jgi:hypothetical protein